MSKTDYHENNSTPTDAELIAALQDQQDRLRVAHNYLTEKRRLKALIEIAAPTRQATA